MVEWMILPFKRYADFTGRSRRMEYWSFMLLNIGVYILLALVMFATGASMASLASADAANPLALYSVFFSGIGLVFFVWWLVTIVPGIAVAVRRLHDRDMSGWWLLGFFVANLVPLVNMIAGIVFLVLMLLPGTAGPNQYGPDPKDPDGAEVFA
ncbi:membrane protein [Novosphingobium marinum]|uniref:Uncharacterized membrane protein YhaH (DUF805 family) n=1 Tax=Novosphingobium marinum TaxID=1514948 RepID=A0A7Z0BTQ3_9SPHN|nr:DUF805 domain-containing protein [Novosphingobium marinum]NYH95404.1 uncharacterized membrane protein YhaH (DUF805 family) [Novosphingobium marinum]GGC26795.1 membrane protein [Novosphingobium marinum]